ncbi:MAG: cbb3-type cytochrome c oxidase subunit 3 [Sphingomonadales bacterium]|nr:cbb3-type cytochrome c oxidase subunit 3 [Sphingomonadales bacterium]
MQELVQSDAWGLISLVFFFAFFVGVLSWVFRPGSSDAYDDCSNIPLKED